MSRDFSTGEHFIEARKTIAKLTQDEAAEKTGIDRSVISKFENGDFQRLSLDKLRKLSEIYVVSADYLLGYTNYPFKNEEGDLFTQTGLTIEALQNLREIDKRVCKPASHVKEDLLSSIISSGSFAQLIVRIVDLAILADDLQEHVNIAQAMDSPEVNLDFLESSVRALKYGRYAVLDPCNAILDELIETSVDEVIGEVIGTVK